MYEIDTHVTLSELKCEELCKGLTGIVFKILIKLREGFLICNLLNLIVENGGNHVSTDFLLNYPFLDYFSFSTYSFFHDESSNENAL